MQCIIHGFQLPTIALLLNTKQITNAMHYTWVPTSNKSRTSQHKADYYCNALYMGSNFQQEPYFSTHSRLLIQCIIHGFQLPTRAVLLNTKQITIAMHYTWVPTSNKCLTSQLHLIQNKVR